MKYLSRPQSGITIVLEVLRQGDEVRMLRAKVGVVVHHARLRRIKSVQQRTARRIAQRKLRVRVIEPRASRGESVNIRGLDHRVAVATQLRTQVVRDDEENVVFWFGGRRS